VLEAPRNRRGWCSNWSKWIAPASFKRLRREQAELRPAIADGTDTAVAAEAAAAPKPAAAPDLRPWS